MQVTRGGVRWGFRIWDGVDLKDELFLNYEHLPAEAKAMIPLGRAWVLNEDALS